MAVQSVPMPIPLMRPGIMVMGHPVALRQIERIMLQCSKTSGQRDADGPVRTGAGAADHEEWLACGVDLYETPGRLRGGTALVSRRLRGHPSGTLSSQSRRTLSAVMAQHETLLQMAQRHVAESSRRVDHQTALVAELEQQGRDTAKAQALLASFSNTLRIMCEVLAREQEREAKVRNRQLRQR